MTRVLITVDTELSAGMFQRGASLADNVASSIRGACDAGEFGIFWQMDVLEAHGLTGSFFVDPLPALIHGGGFLSGIVEPVLARGHEVQLHLHSEWLEWAASSPVGDRRGRSIGDFSAEDQHALLELATQLLVDAGAPRPIAFRAGNFGANDDTLDALHRLGFGWDTSFNPAFASSGCRISLPTSQTGPVRHRGIVEVPVAAIGDAGGGVRPAQVCALSSREMRAALCHAASAGQPVFSIVTHSFEMLSRDRMRPNRMVMRRFIEMCETIASNEGLEPGRFVDLAESEVLGARAAASRLPFAPRRRWARICEQVASQWRYERRLLPQ